MPQQNIFRLFIAISLPPVIKEKIAQICYDWKTNLLFRNWVHTEDYHITLFFLGDTEETRIPFIHHELTEIAKTIHPFQLSLSHVGTFGRIHAPRILWLGVEGNLDHLTNLHLQTATAMEELNYMRENRPYQPHITIARKYNDSTSEFPELQSLQGVLPIESFQVEQITLYRTELGSQPMYHPVHIFNFSQE